jgi:hypothetical protein
MESKYYCEYIKPFYRPSLLPVTRHGVFFCAHLRSSYIYFGAFSLPANYTDRAIAAYRRSQFQL